MKKQCMISNRIINEKQKNTTTQNKSSGIHNSIDFSTQVDMGSLALNEDPMSHPKPIQSAFPRFSSQAAGFTSFGGNTTYSVKDSFKEKYYAERMYSEQLTKQVQALQSQAKHLVAQNETLMKEIEQLEQNGP